MDTSSVDTFQTEWLEVAGNERPMVATEQTTTQSDVLSYCFYTRRRWSGAFTICLYCSRASLLSYLPPFHDSFTIYEYLFEPVFIQKRNEREQQWENCVNLAYAKLRDHLPNGSSNKWLIKVKTLWAAIRYIKYLQELVESKGRGVKCGNAATFSSRIRGVCGKLTL